MRSMRHPSPATLIALLALFVAVGGPAEASRLLNGKNIKKGTITGRQIKNRSLGAGELSKAARARLTATPDGSISTAKLADGAVTGPKILPGAIGSGEVMDGGIGTAELADSAVTGSKLAAGAIGSGSIGGDAITADKIADGLLAARDVASFVGTASIDFDPIAVDACTFEDVPVTAVATTTPARSITDDAVVVTPPPSFPDTAVLLTAAPQSATTLRVRVCNRFGADEVDLPALTYRYVSFDF